MPTHLVIHFAEIALKGHNRPLFEKRLVENVRRSVAPLPHGKIQRARGRILLELTETQYLEQILNRVGRVFGISWLAPVEFLPKEFQAIQESVVKRVGEELASRPASSFKMRVRRADKTYPYDSMQIARVMGRAIKDRYDLDVSMKGPEMTVYLDVLDRGMLLYFRRYRGPGGLPVGSSGQVLHLLSGGIDSPVAAWLLLKRGCKLTYLHFHAYADWHDAANGKVAFQVRRLAGYGGEGDLYLAPYHHFQMRALGAMPELELVLFRRFMLKLGEALAGKLGLSALSTGESLAQVASQTLENMTAVSQGLTMQVLRPLLTYDKEEIVELSKRIGTFEASIQDYKDCCSIISRHPETKATFRELIEAESQLGVDQVVQETLDETVRIAINSEHESPVLTTA